MFESSITIDDVIDALADFLTPFVGASEIVRAQENRVAPPLGPFVVLTELLQIDLSKPHLEYEPPTDPIPAVGVAAIHGPTQIDVQIDFYGPNAGQYCKSAIAAFRTSYATSAMPESIQPLYMSDGVQSPLTTAEQQYLSRWTATASMQYNPIITTPQEFAEEAKVSLVEAADLVGPVI